MKLYYVPGVCSLAPHVALREAGLPFTLDRVDRKTKHTQSGQDFNAINPKGYVPLLETDGGERLSEVAVILQYIADQKPEAGLAPPAGTMARYRLQEMLNFLATEVHKGYAPLFNKDLPAEFRAAPLVRLQLRLASLDQTLTAQPFLMGQQLTVADCYLYTVLRWSPRVDVDLSSYTGLTSFMARLEARPSVVAALVAEAT